MASKLHEGMLEANGVNCDNGDCWCWEEHAPRPKAPLASKKQVSAVEAFKVLVEEIDAAGVFLDRPADAVKFISQCVSSALTKLIQQEAPEFEPSADWKRANELSEAEVSQ